MTEIESRILGAVLADRSVKHMVIPALNEDMFTADVHRRVYRAMQSLLDKDRPIDHLTVIDQLEKMGIREDLDAFALTEISGGVATSANVEYHVKLLTENWIRNEVSAMASTYSLEIADNTIDVFECLDNFIRDLSKYNDQIAVGVNRSVRDVAEKVYREALEAKDSDTHLSGLSSGMMDLDMITKGFKAPQLVIIAARPAMGKTALMMNLSSQYSFDGNPVGIFSCEMSAEELTRRLISMESGIATQDIEIGNFHDILPSVTKVKGHEIYINDTAGINTRELQIAARKMKSQYGVKAIMVDYIQLMYASRKHGNREQEVSEISRTLKRIAKTLDIPVIALSQLSRKCEERSDKRPVLSDLRESGAIEQDADIVIFMYRPEYYGEMYDEDGNDLKGVTELNISKHRGGKRGRVLLEFHHETTRFTRHQQDPIF